jgi:quinohemoprotein ethanol dehydrogenase
MAFNSTLRLVYVPATEGTVSLFAPDPGWKSDPTNWNGGTDRRYEGPLFTKLQAAPAPVGKLIAWNPIEKREVWHVTHPGVESAGVLASAGDLVFQGRSDGIFLAYRATDGKKLWEYDTGTGILAPPVSYMLDGVQYVTVMAGWGGDPGIKNFPKWGITKPGFGRILTFALGGTAKLEIAPFGHSGPPKPAIRINASRETVHEGNILYRTHCYHCHGFNAVAGSLPDLRYATAEVHKQFSSIVLGGARESRGMPSFKDLLNDTQVHAIEAYVLSRAEESAHPAAN